MERQQIKWFAYASVAAAGGGLLRSVVPVTLEVAWLRWAGFVPMVVGLSSIPISMGIAIMRYRLYEIDLIINRTLVYGSLSLILAALYLGGIVISQRVFASLTGRDSTLAVVASTLLIAALFHPLRRRIKSLVHRRFYRRKYPARKTLEAFSATLREETDLRELNDELVKVVRDTMPRPTSLMQPRRRTPRQTSRRIHRSGWKINTERQSLGVALPARAYYRYAQISAVGREK